MSENQENGIEITGGTDSPASNLLERGRYVSEIDKDEVKEFIANSGNRCFKVVQYADGIRIDDVFVLKLRWHMVKLRNFLYSIGIRRSGKFFLNINEVKVALEKCNKVKIDVKVGKDKDGANKNEVTNYVPIDSEEAPVAGVPEEEPKEKESNKEKEIASTPEAEGDDI